MKGWIQTTGTRLSIVQLLKHHENLEDPFDGPQLVSGGLWWICVLHQGGSSSFSSSFGVFVSSPRSERSLIGSETSGGAFQTSANFGRIKFRS